MQKRKNLIRIGIGILILVIIGFALARKKGWLGSESVTKVSAELVTKRTIIESVSANGKIEPEVEVKLSPDVSGEVIELYVKEGDKINAGDLLAKINPELYISSYDRSVAMVNTQRANLANSNARLSQVKSQFINAKSTFDRNDILYKQQTISQAEYDGAKAAFEVAKAEVNAAEETVKAADYSVKSADASVKESKENLSKTSIYAPVSGTISKLNIEKGERVAGASQFSSGTEILRIANLASMQVNVSVNENDIVRVHLNDTALIEVDAYLNRKFKGIVTEISTSANVQGVSADQVTNFEVKIRILPDSYKDLLKSGQENLSPFRPGMSATVDIQTKTVQNVLTVPIQSVTTRSDTTDNKPKNEEKTDNEGENIVSSQTDESKKKDISFKEYVFVLENGTAKMVVVKTGIQDNTNIEILSGLKEKQEVITGPYRAVTKKLKDGDVVKKVDKKDLFTEEK
ncbi:MAG: efflux RND transporter periplasmic adaptor subunit [Bacteroidales bacterium]